MSDSEGEHEEVVNQSVVSEDTVVSTSIVEEDDVDDTSSSDSTSRGDMQHRVTQTSVKSFMTAKSSPTGAQMSPSNRLHPSAMSALEFKSVFSLTSNADADDALLLGEEFFEQIWGKTTEWMFGRYIRDMARAVHREHAQRAAETQGGIPKGARLKMPSAWGEIDISGASEASGVSVATTTSVKPRLPESKQQVIATEICAPEVKKEVLTKIKDDINEEELLLKEIHPYFSGNNPVLIWTPFDSISPRVRLSSPFEVVVLSFCPHDGNYLIGGTSCGQVVLWDLTGRIQSKSENIYYSTDPSYLESQRVINSQLKWRRSKSSFQQIYPTATTLKRDCHAEKIINIQWINCDSEFDCKSGKVMPRVGNKISFQFLTTSEDRVMKVWDMRSEPKPAITLRYPDKGFTKTSAAKRPPNLQQTSSKYSELNRRWGSIYTAEPKHDDASFFFSTCCFSQEYFLNPPKEKKGNEKALEGAFFGTLNGDVGYLTWEGVPFESVTAGAVDAMDTQTFKGYHDGPVNCIARHPVFQHICISTGGHVFAIWSLDYPSEPIKWVRYREVIVTACRWSETRPSIFKVARSDGLLEFWDLLVYSHRPRIDPLCTGNGITMTVDLDIPPRQFIAIADITASLRLYYTAGQNRKLTEEELDDLGEMMNREPERKKKLELWAEKWLSEHMGREQQSFKPDKEEVHNVRHSQIRPKEAVQQTPCNPFMVHLYRWYLRRRGEKSVWLDEADKKWFAQEQAHMKNQILSNKMWDQKKMDIVMRQLDMKEKRETLRKQRVQEILDQADEIFKTAVADIFIKQEVELKASKISVKLDEPKEFDIHSAIQETQLLFGENSKKFEGAKMADVTRFPVKERKMLDVLAKYRQVRMVFNDSRRYRDSKLKWLRNKLRKEVEKYGCELIEWQTKTNTLMKWEKYERRIKDIDKLRENFGVHYNPLWDKEIRVSKFEKRMAIGNIRVRYTVPRKAKPKKGLDLKTIIAGGDVSVLDPDEDNTGFKINNVVKPDESAKDQVVEQESIISLDFEEKDRQVELVKESVDLFTSHLPEIRKSVSFVEEVTPEEESPSGGVLPLPDLVPRDEPDIPQRLPSWQQDVDTRPYLETLLAQPIESEEGSEYEDFEPDITVMEKHKDVDNIVDKLSSVYAMLKADVSIKAELHRFKWETTEEYLVSEDEEEKKAEEQMEEEMEQEDEVKELRRSGDVDVEEDIDDYMD